MSLSNEASAAMRSMKTESTTSTLQNVRQCDYCGGTLSTEKGFKNHACRKKKAAQGAGEAALKRAYYLFCFWFKYNTYGKQKNYDEFTRSPYFEAFVKLEAASSKLFMGSSLEYVRWLSNERIPARDWGLDHTLASYRKHVEECGDAESSVMSSLARIASWCDSRKVDISCFFSEIPPGELMLWLQNGKLSPWVPACAETFGDALARMSEEQLYAMAVVYDAAYWDARIRAAPHKSSAVIEILKTVGM